MRDYAKFAQGAKSAYTKGKFLLNSSSYMSIIIPVLVRNETYSIPGSPPSQPSPIKGEGVLMVDLISIISNYKRYYFRCQNTQIIPAAKSPAGGMCQCPHI
jgi:hypothetical protein